MTLTWKNRETIEPPTAQMMKELWELMEDYVVSPNLNHDKLPEAIRLVCYNRKEKSSSGSKVNE